MDARRWVDDGEVGQVGYASAGSGTDGISKNYLYLYGLDEGLEEKYEEHIAE